MEPAALGGVGGRDDGLPWQLTPHLQPLLESGLRAAGGGKHPPCPPGASEDPPPRAVTLVLRSGPTDRPPETFPHKG